MLVQTGGFAEGSLEERGQLLQDSGSLGVVYRFLVYVKLYLVDSAGPHCHEWIPVFLCSSRRDSVEPAHCASIDRTGRGSSEQRESLTGQAYPSFQRWKRTAMTVRINHSMGSCLATNGKLGWALHVGLGAPCRDPWESWVLRLGFRLRMIQATADSKELVF